MNNYLPAIIEVATLLVILMIAGAMAAPFRKRRAEARRPEVLPTPSPLLLLAFIAGPLIVLLLTSPAIWLLGRFLPIADWLAEHGDHLRAWRLFWLIVLGIDLAEGSAQLVFALRKRSFPLPDLLQAILRTFLVLAAGFLALRIGMGINIAPLLASTALVTAVIGFALQGVLGNLLAGMSLHIVRSILPTDWVRIGDQEGRVVATNWRETRLHTTDGFKLVVPNAQVASAVIHNMSRPDTRRRHRLNVGASYSDAPEAVIQALVEAAVGVPEILKRPAPAAFVTEFQDYGVNYQLQFWSNRYHLRLPLEGEVNRRIWYKFKRRGIEIPFPMSDKLLNDFMAVVYNQRRLAPEPAALDSVVRDLVASDFSSRFCVDGEGACLLSEEDFASIAPAVIRQLYTKGETIVVQGEAGDSLFVVVRGSLKGEIEQEGQTPSIEFELGAGAVFGEMSLMLSQPRGATVTATEECELLLINAVCFKRLLSLHEDIPEKLADLAAARAAENRAAGKELEDRQGDDPPEELDRGNILQRFLTLIGK